MINREDSAKAVFSYFTRMRPFSFVSNLDTVTTSIALLEDWLEEYKDDCEKSFCPEKRKFYKDVSTFVQLLRGSF